MGPWKKLFLPTCCASYWGMLVCFVRGTWGEVWLSSTTSLLLKQSQSLSRQCLRQKRSSVAVPLTGEKYMTSRQLNPDVHLSHHGACGFTENKQLFEWPDIPPVCPKCLQSDSYGIALMNKWNISLILFNYSFKPCTIRTWAHVHKTLDRKASTLQTVMLCIWRLVVHWCNHATYRVDHPCLRMELFTSLYYSNGALGDVICVNLGCPF